MNIFNKVSEFEKLQDEIAEYFKPRIHRLCNEGKINKGRYPKNQQLENCIFLKSFYIQDIGKDVGKITVEIEVDWGISTVK